MMTLLLKIKLWLQKIMYFSPAYKIALTLSTPQVEEVDSTLASWQPMVASGISGNRELILQLNSRIEVLENQVTSLLNERARTNDGRRAGGREEDVRGGREYVRMARGGAEDEGAEVPTNSGGLLPMQTVKALFDGTSAMKFRVEGRRTWRALLLEAELYHAPEDGWGERVYLCTAPQVLICSSNETKLSIKLKHVFLGH